MICSFCPFYTDERAERLMRTFFNRDNHYRIRAYRGDLESGASDEQIANPITAPTTFDDDNAGANDRGTVSPYGVTHDRTLTVGSDDGLFPNDINWAGAPPHVASHTPPQHGTLSLNDDGSFTYTPNPGFLGIDTFTYKATNDVQTGTDTIVALDVVDAAPVASRVFLDDPTFGDVQYNGQTYHVAVEGDAGASDADGDPVTYQVADGPKHGTVSLDPATGHFVYAAGPDFAGVDRFTYTATDGLQQGIAAEVVIVSHKVLAHSDPYFNVPNTGAPQFVADGAEPRRIYAGSGFSHGTINVNPSDYNSGVSYTPDAGFTGADVARVEYESWQPFTGKPTTMLIHVRDPSPDPYTIYNDFVPGNMYYRVNDTQASQVTSDLTGFLPPGLGLSISMGQQPQHGQVYLDTQTGAFTYTPDPSPDPQTDKPYQGWQFFSYMFRDQWGDTLEQWVQLDLGNYAPPGTPVDGKPATVQWPARVGPGPYPATFDGLQQSYNDAVKALQNLLQAMGRFGQAVRAVSQAAQATDLLFAEADARLTAVGKAYDAYATKAAQTNSLAGQYMKTIWLTGLDDVALLNKIEHLPTTVGGFAPARDQLLKWQMALGNFAAGADWMVGQQQFNLQAARETHDALNQTIQIVGTITLAGGIVTTGAELASAATCKAFVQLASKQFVNLAAGVAVSIAGQGVVALVREFGGDEDAARIAADSFQLYFLYRAARAQQKARGANCFAAGTEVQTANGPVPIQQVQVGQRVLTQVDAGPASGGPPPVPGDASATAVDPATWRLVSLDMPDPQHPGDDYRMQLLEPLSWVQEYGATAGSWVNLDLPELQVSGKAEVESVGECPPIQGGGGRVVLGTFEHVSDDLVGVGLNGEAKPLEVTAGHKLWSLDRGGWVAAGDLRAGERLATERGAATVSSVTAEAGSQDVYNLDVEVDHRYLVTRSGVLAHNADPCGFGSNGPMSGAAVTNRDCVGDAKAIAGQLASQGLPAVRYRVQPGFSPSGRRAPWIGSVNCPGGGQTTRPWAFHEYVKVGGRVYDNITGPAGMPFEEYKGLFVDGDLCQWDIPGINKP